jgi:hypothetical protein
MREKLDQLLNDDIVARWRLISISAFVVALVGFAAQLTGSAVRDAQITATIVGCLVFASQVALYLLPAHKVLSSIGQRRTYLVRSGLTIAASAAIAFMVSASAPKVQAAILNRRLKAALAELHSESVQPAQAAGNVFKTALNARVHLRPDLVAQATAELKADRNAETWQAYMALLTYIVNWRYDPEGLEWRLDRLNEILRTAPVCGSRNEGFNAAEFTTKDGRVTKFADISKWPKAIFSCSLVLDGRTLSDTDLDYLVVKYHGGPADMKNVRLTTVKFDLDDTPNARRLAEAILNAHDNTLTFRAE